MLQQLNTAFRATLLLTILTGLIYPGIVTGLCQVLFRDKANGSLISQNGQIVGSRLIGQDFRGAKYFHPRPSAAGNGYDATSSSGSNLGPTNQKLYDRVKAAAAQFRQENPDYQGAIPADALTTSGSGLDPDITIANARAQAGRVGKARGSADQVEIGKLIASATNGRDLGFLGEARVNVLELNLALDKSIPARH